MVNSKMEKKKETSSNKQNNDNNRAGILDQTRRRPLRDGRGYCFMMSLLALSEKLYAVNFADVFESCLY